MSRYACIDKDNVVQQVIEWDGVALWSPPDGQTPVLLPDELFIEPRGTLDTKAMTFVRAEPPVITQAELEAAIPQIAEERAVSRINALVDVLGEKGTITPQDVVKIDAAVDAAGGAAVSLAIDSPP
jgi:hypothetical protein